MSERQRVPLLERLGIAVAGVALAAVLIALVSGYFNNHDQGAISGARSSVGTTLPDQGDRLLKPNELRPLYNSDPPTSGAHAPAPITRQLQAFSDNQILTALAAGNVVVLYGTPQPPAGLRKLVRSLSAPFTPALASAGEAVILGRRARLRGVIALAWTHILRQPRPSSATLARFIDRWLGVGAPQE